MNGESITTHDAVQAVADLSRPDADERTVAPGTSWAGTAGMAAGLLVLVLSQLLPPPDPITRIGMVRVGLLVCAIAWWIAAPVPLAITTFAVLGIGIGAGALSLNEAFAADTSWVLWFLVGAFGLSAALESNGFNRRFALWFVNLSWLRGRPYALLFMFLLSAGLMSGLMSNTVVTVVWLALATTIYSAIGLKKGDEFAEINTLGIAWLANIGGIMTPIGTPGNAVSIGLIAAATGTTIGFGAWTLVGTFAGALFIGSAFLVIRFVLRPDVSVVVRPESVAFLRAQQQSLGPWLPAERWSVAGFAAAIFLWFLPDLLRLALPPESMPSFAARLGLAVPALLLPCALCLIPVKQPGRTRVLTWEEWSSGVDWGMVLFMGGVLALGTAIGEPETGLTAFVQQRLGPAITGLPEYLFVFALSTAVIVATNLMSNLVTTAIFVPLGLTLSLSLGVGHPLAIGIILGIAPSLDYILPSGTTTNAIVAGTGWLRIGMMARMGTILAILHAFIIALLVYPFAKWVLS